MALSRLQQTVSFKNSGYHEQPRQDATDTVRHEFGPHCPLPHYQYQEDSFNQTSDFEALIPQFPTFTLPYNAPLWNTHVDGLPTLGYALSSFSNDYLASRTSSITPPPFPTISPSLPNANQFSISPEPFQNSTTPTGDFLPQETIHREHSSVHDPFSNTRNENYIVGQMATLHDRVHPKSPSPKNHPAEAMSSLVSNEMTKSYVSTLSPQN